MRRLKIINSNTAIAECYLEKNDTDFLVESSISTIISNYLFNHTDNHIQLPNNNIQFFFNDRNLNLLKEAIQDKSNLILINQYIEKQFKIKNNINNINFSDDLSILENIFHKTNLILSFEKDTFNIPDMHNIKHYIHNRYFYEYEYTKIYSDIEISLSDNAFWVFTIDLTLEGKFKPENIDFINTFNNVGLNCEYCEDKIIFKGDIHEEDKDLKWIM